MAQPSSSSSSVLATFSASDERKLRLLEAEVKQLRSSAVNADKLKEELYMKDQQLASYREQQQTSLQVEDENRRLRQELVEAAEFQVFLKQAGFVLLLLYDD